MAYAAMKPTKPGLEEPQEQIHKIRITLSSKNVKNLEKGLLSFLYFINGHAHMTFFFPFDFSVLNYLYANIFHCFLYQRLNY